MSAAPTTTYQVEHKDGWRVSRLPVDDVTMHRARLGEQGYQRDIATAFRAQLASVNNGNAPREVDYGHLTFAPVANASDDSHDDVGEGGCGCDCRGCDDNIRHCGKRDRGCKH